MIFTSQDIKQFWKVRRQLEKLSKKTSHIESSNLQGGCTLGAFLIHCYLKEKGYKSKIVMCEGHSYTQVHNVVVDVTATQFGIKNKVFITSVRNYKRRLHNNKYGWVLHCPNYSTVVRNLPYVIRKWSTTAFCNLSIPNTLYYENSRI